MPIYTIQTPEGRKLKIEAADEATALAGAKDWSAKNAKPKGKPSAVTRAAGVMANFNRAIPLGDELAAGVDTAVNFLSGRPADFNVSMAKQRSLERSGMENDRTASNLARGTGMATSMLAPGGAAVQGGRGINIARGAVAGATEGAVYGLTDEGNLRERLGAANRGAALGAVVGGIGGALAPTAARAKPPKAKPVPLEELQAAKTRAYKAAEDAQIVFDSKAIDDLVDATAAEMRAGRLNDKLNPTASELLGEFQKLKGSNPSLSDIDEFRQFVNLNRKGISDADARQVDKIVANIDEFLDAAGPEQIVSGNSEAPGELIRAARDANQRYRKVETVMDAVETAKRRTGSTNSGGNIDNATRQELRRVLEKSKGLTPDERSALTDVVMGDKAQNVLRTVGRLSPTNGGLMALGGTVMASTGPGAAVPIGGYLAKTISDRMTQTKVQDLLGLMAAGGKPAADAEDELFSLAAKNPQVQKAIADLIGRSRRATVSAAATRQPATNILATSRQ